MRHKLIPILTVAFLTLSQFLHGDRDVAPYPYHGRDVGIIFPTTVRKGYYVSFSSCWDGRNRGFHGWDSGEFDPLPEYAGGREIQVRQSEDGINWEDWSESFSPRYSYPPAITMPAMLITGNYVQVRHRVNTTNDYSIFSDGDVVGEWKVFDIEVLPNVPLLDVMDPTQVSLEYFKGFVPLFYAPEDFTRPDYFTFTHEWLPDGGKPIEDEVYVTTSDLDPYAVDWDYPRGKNWLNAYIQRVNFFRKMAGVMPLILASDEDNRIAQRTSLFYHLYRAINHDLLLNKIEEDGFWAKIWNEDDAWAGKHGIITVNGYGRDDEIWDRYVEPVVEFMDDQFNNNTQVGHRLTLLNPALDQLAVGGVPGLYQESFEGPEYDINISRDEIYVAFATHGTRPFSKNKDFDDLDKMTRDQAVFWPAPGYVPWDVVPARFSGHDVYVDIPDLAAIDELPVIEFFWSNGEIDYIDSTRCWVQDDNDIRARVWINGEEVDVTVCWGSLDTRYRRLDFVVQIQDYPTYYPETGEFSEPQTLFDMELREIYPDHDEIAGGYNPLPGWSNSLYFGTNEPAAMYPRPKYGPDYIHIEVYLVVDEERQEEYGLQPTYDLIEYDVYPFDPMVVFSDDYYATDEAVLSEKFGWYNADKLPWIYSFEQKSWMYVTGVGDNKWIWDAEIGWFYQPSYYPWIYSQDLGQWIYYMDTDGETRRYASETGEIIYF